MSILTCNNLVGVRNRVSSNVSALRYLKRTAAHIHAFRNYIRLYTFTSSADRTKLIMDRGRSVDPELVLPRQRYSHSSLPRQQKRAQSAAPNAIRLSQLYNDQGEAYSNNMSSTLPKSTERALINQHVNPYQEFPSLR